MLFNVGMGFCLQSDGQIWMLVFVMNGRIKKFSGVMNVQYIQNFIFLVKVFEWEDDCVFVGEGVNLYVEKLGILSYNVEILEWWEEYFEIKKISGIGMVGCVVFDQFGNFVVVIFIGGKGFELVGRVFDLVIVVGNYVNDFCVVSCIGVGEDIISCVIVVKIVIWVMDGSIVKVVFEKIFQELKVIDGFVGVIVLDYKGISYYIDFYLMMVFVEFDGNMIIVFN